MILSSALYTRPQAAATVQEQLQGTIDHCEGLIDQWEQQHAEDTEKLAALDRSIVRLDRRSRLGWGITVAGGALLVGGLVYGAVAGVGTLAAIPGIAVTFGGLGLAQFSDSSFPKMERWNLQQTSGHRRQLMDQRLYPRLESARAALHAEEERQQQEMQALLDGMRSVGQLAERSDSWLIGGAVLRKKRKA